MINCEIELDLLWLKECIVSEISVITRVPPNPDANASIQEVPEIQLTGATFQINKAKLYVPVVTLSINDNIKFLENIKQGFKRTISWNKFRSEISTQTKNNNLDYLIDLTFEHFNKLLVLSFKNGTDDPTRDSFYKYYMPLVEIEGFNPFIDNEPFFDQPLKNKQEPCEKFVKMS